MFANTLWFIREIRNKKGCSRKFKNVICHNTNPKKGKRHMPLKHLRWRLYSKTLCLTYSELFPVSIQRSCWLYPELTFRTLAWKEAIVVPYFEEEPFQLHCIVSSVPHYCLVPYQHLNIEVAWEVLVLVLNYHRK